jgi:uncharacterized protein YlxW (UPF0749 family)
MCLTSTVDVIDYNSLSPKQKKQLDVLKRKLQARRKALQERINDLDRGLQKLEKKKSKRKYR